jgi:hypothetical protein
MLKDPSGFELNLKDGEEGETTLTISLYDLLLANQKWPSLVETCEGEVDRQAPKISLLEGKLTVNPGQQIEISTTDDQGAQVLSCWMKSSAHRCEQDCVNYLNQSSKIKAPLDGEWNLCYFAVDSAGNRSAVQSASISVVNSERIGRLRASLSNAEFLMKQGDIFSGLAKVMATQSEINSLSNVENRKALQKEALLKTLNLSFSALPFAWLSYNQKSLRFISSDDAQRVLVADSGKGDDNLETWYWTKDGRDKSPDKISDVDRRFAAVYEENFVYKSVAYFSSAQRITLHTAQNTAPIDFPSPANKGQCEPDRMLVDNLSVMIPCNRTLYRYNLTDGVWIELGKWTVNSKLELMGNHVLWWDAGSDVLNVYDSGGGLKQQFKIPTIEKGTTLQRPFFVSETQYFCGVYQTNPILSGVFGNAIGGVRRLRCFASISQAEMVIDQVVDGKVDYSQQTVAFKQKDGPIQLISLMKNQISEIKQSELGLFRGISAHNTLLVERSMAEGIVVISYDIHSLEEKASVYSKFAKSSKLSLNKRAIAIEQNSYWRILAADSLVSFAIVACARKCAAAVSSR